MRITPRLLEVASLLLATGYVVACGGSVTTGDGSDASTGGDGSTGNPDGGGGGDASCGCGCATTVSVTADQACSMLATSGSLSTPTYGPACQSVCGPGGGSTCAVPEGFFSEVEALNPDVTSDGGPLTLVCPTDAGSVTVSCTINCVGGRLTEGYAAPARGGATDADRFAAMAFLEAVSVHAFERLERELAAHGATPNLLRDARRARRDEQRHTAMMTRLARREGGCARRPDPPEPAAVRSLVAVAIENAVEGCVRESYGAVVGLIEAETAADASVRGAMRSIAADECRHAELAWAVHAWAAPQLSPGEKDDVERAMRGAIEEIAARDPHTAALLFRDSV